MRIPDARRAYIDRRKLVAYCLDLTHPIGRHKAVVFRSALGWTERDADTLQEVLLHAVTGYEAAADKSDQYGQRYTVDFPVTTAAGSAMLRSAWIIRADEDFLVS